MIPPDYREISPHPWGWPAGQTRYRPGFGDFPTPVGMARRCVGNGQPLRRFPHTRGDGPCFGDASFSAFVISPHPWGWPAPNPLRPATHVDFPTPVGMARLFGFGAASRRRFPHTRGDGPNLRLTCSTPCLISPHPWGWPACRGSFRLFRRDFPTPVGMARLRVLRVSVVA